VAGSKVPLVLTQGLTENNTVADGLQQYLDNHTGYERAWLGPWKHVRGNETDPDTGKLAMGRAGWFDEVIRLYDPTATSGVWTISKPLPYDPHLAGSGTMVVNVTTTIPHANLAVDVYDLDANGTGPLITRQGHLVRSPGDSSSCGRPTGRLRPGAVSASASPTTTRIGGYSRRQRCSRSRSTAGR
jgi:X-Pro dipeptidyl-peptidase C-terminal non-catalytic domain